MPSVEPSAGPTVAAGDADATWPSPRVAVAQQLGATDGTGRADEADGKDADIPSSPARDCFIRDSIRSLGTTGSHARRADAARARRTGR